MLKKFILEGKYIMKCKFYSEKIDKCLFDGPPDDCPYQDDHSKCNCFKPIKENKKESKNMKNHKSYSTHICKYYWNDSCHYSEKVFGGSPASCHCVNDFENNCICFEPSIEYEKESYSKKEQKIEINLKEIKQDAVTQFVNLVDKKLDYYDRHNIKLSAFYLSSMMKEVLHELGYED